MTDINKNFSLGVIQLNTNFPRIIGDIGNKDTFDFPVFYEKVSSASVSAVVSSSGITDAVKSDIFSKIANLEQKGVNLIVTTCGFLGEIQTELQAHANVPVLTSSLLTIPFARNFKSKGEKIGIITFDKNSLNEKHFSGHFDNDIVIQDIDKKGELYGTIKNDRDTLDIEKSNKEVGEATKKLLEKDPNIKVIILECTNLPPYIETVKSNSSLPVFDIIQAINWFKNAL